MHINWYMEGYRDGMAGRAKAYNFPKYLEGYKEGCRVSKLYKKEAKLHA